MANNVFGSRFYSGQRVPAWQDLMAKHLREQGTAGIVGETDVSISAQSLLN